MWAVEKDPALRSDFTNITVLERSPEPGRLRSAAERLVGAIPRLAQRVVSAPLRIAPPEWQPDPTFDLDHHLRRVALPGPGGMRQLLDYAAAASADPFDRSRPLWELTLVEGLSGGRSALIQRLHHTITDGVGGLRLSLGFLDFEPDPLPGPTAPAPPGHDPVETAAPEPGRSGPLDVLGSSVAYAAQRPLTFVRDTAVGAATTIAHPERIPATASEAWHLGHSLRRQVLVTDRARSPLFARRSLGIRYDTLQVPIAPVKTLAGALDGTLNDVFVATISGGLGRYHAALGTTCPELRMAMPVNLRTEGGAHGNAFAPARALVPIQPTSIVARFAAIRDTLRRARSERALRSADAIAGFAAVFPTSLLVAATRSQVRTIDFACSNLRGSPVPLYLAGARIEANFPFGPRTGSALNLTVLSYVDRLDIGIHSDPDAVTEPELLLVCLRDAFAEVTGLAADTT